MKNDSRTIIRGIPAGQQPRFFVPIKLARLALGAQRFMKLPTETLVDEICFGSRKRLHETGKRHFVCTGDLRPYLVPVADNASGTEVRQILEADFDYRSTDKYRQRVRRLESGRPQKVHRRVIDNRKDIDDYFEYRCELIRSMQSFGCLSRHDLTNGHAASVPEFSLTKRFEHDIGCVIGPAGEIWMHWTGHHRLQIARALGIREIPAEIHFVHWHWLKRCYDCYGWSPFQAIAAGLDRIRTTTPSAP